MPTNAHRSWTEVLINASGQAPENRGREETNPIYIGSNVHIRKYVHTYVCILEKSKSRTKKRREFSIRKQGKSKRICQPSIQPTFLPSKGRARRVSSQDNSQREYHAHSRTNPHNREGRGEARKRKGGRTKAEGTLSQPSLRVPCEEDSAI